VDRSRRLLLTAGLIAIAAGAIVARVDAQTVRPKTLTRTEDWVVVPGAELPRLKGQPCEKLRAYACRGGSMVPVPYQVDERRGEGGYCFTDGDAQYHVKDQDNGLFDDNDELVFMSRDTGDLAAESAFPPGVKAGHLIELKDPKKGGASGWIYLFAFDAPPPRSTVRYAHIERRKDKTVEWHGERFYSDNGRSPHNVCRLTTLKFAKPEDATPDYAKCNNVIDCSKVTLRAKKLFMSIQRDSSDVYVDIGGYINGPVRVICQNLVEINVALGFTIRCPDSFLFLYANATTMPTNVDLPVDLSDSEGTSWYKLLVDLSKERAKGWKFYNEKNSTPVTIDGKMDAAEQKLNKAWPSWNCMFGPEGAIMVRMVLDKRAQRATNQLYYSDNVEEEEAPEFEPGNFGTVGLKVDLTGLTSGTYAGDYIIWYAPAPFAQGDEQKYLDILDSPLQRQVQ
jgi:hypothetical protein